MHNISNAIFLVLATQAAAQYRPGGPYGPGGGGGRYSDNNDDGNDGPFGSSDGFMSGRQKILIAHGVLASLAFVIFFPLGSILIRLGSFRGLWLIHGLFQIFAYVIYVVAFGIGIYIVRNVPVDILNNYHPVIGITVFALLFFQPFLGLMHHFQYKKLKRRTLWSYGHLWLGRIAITLGMINGGLGMFLATETGRFEPTRGQIIAYGVVAGLMWVAWVAASVTGERRRNRSRKVAEIGTSKEQYA